MRRIALSLVVAALPSLGVADIYSAPPVAAPTPAHVGKWTPPAPVVAAPTPAPVAVSSYADVNIVSTHNVEQNMRIPTLDARTGHVTLAQATADGHGPGDPLADEHHRYVAHAPHTPDTATIKVVRPDATGAFPGDYSTLPLGREFVAFPGNPSFAAAAVAPTAPSAMDEGKWSGPTGEAYGSKYEPAGKYSGKYGPVAPAPAAADVAPVRMSPPAYEAHEVYRPAGAQCFVISKTEPYPHVGYRYVCEY